MQLTLMLASGGPGASPPLPRLWSRCGGGEQDVPAVLLAADGGEGGQAGIKGEL